MLGMAKITVVVDVWQGLGGTEVRNPDPTPKALALDGAVLPTVRLDDRREPYRGPPGRR